MPTDSEPTTGAAGPVAWGALLKVHAALVPALDRELQSAAGMPLAWYDVLLELTSAPGHRLPMSELGERVVLSRTRVSRVVDELVRHGLVLRAPHPTDGRSTFAEVTAAGRRRFRVAAPVYLRGIEAHFAGHLTPRELTTIAAGLGRVREAAERRGQTTPDAPR